MEVVLKITIKGRLWKAPLGYLFVVAQYLFFEVVTNFIPFAGSEIRGTKNREVVALHDVTQRVFFFEPHDEPEYPRLGKRSAIQCSSRGSNRALEYLVDQQNLPTAFLKFIGEIDNAVSGRSRSCYMLEDKEGHGRFRTSLAYWKQEAVFPTPRVPLIPIKAVTPAYFRPLWSVRTGGIGVLNKVGMCRMFHLYLWL